MRNDILGKFGECLFRGWCIVAEYVVNSSIEYDATGWDFKIEPSQLIINNSILGLNPENVYSHSVIDVQVKTTQTDAKEWSIKLKHLIRFAHSPHPAFLCIIQIKLNTDEVENVYLIHIDEKHIKEILEKQRKLASESKDIHNKTLTIKSQPSDIISSNFSKNIKIKLDEVLKQGSNYTTNKQKIIKTVGYDEIGANITFSARPDQIVNTSLGIDKSLPVTSFSIEDLRFNIPILKDLGFGQLMIESEEKDAIISVICPHKDPITFLVKARISPFYNQDIGKLPFASFQHNSFIISMHKGGATISPISPDKISFYNLKIFITLCISIQNRCKLEINLNDNIFDISALKIESNDSFDQILSFCNFAIIHNIGNMEISIENLILQADTLQLMHVLYKENKACVFGMHFKLENFHSDNICTRNIRFPFVLLVKLENIVVAFIFVTVNFEFIYENDGVRFEINHSNTEYLGLFKLKTADISNFDDLYSKKALEYLPKNESMQNILKNGYIHKFGSY